LGVAIETAFLWLSLPTKKKKFPPSPKSQASDSSSSHNHLLLPCDQDIFIMSFLFDLNRDGQILFVTRALRMFSYGALSIVLFEYFKEIGLTEYEIGVLLTLILFGDLVITLFLSTRADHVFGRKNTLMVGALLKLLAGVGFAISGNFAVLVIAGIIGVVSANGGEIGPFLPIEQAALTEICAHDTTTTAVVPSAQTDSDKVVLVKKRPTVAYLFGWYNAFGYLSQAMGALAAGAIVSALQHSYGFSSVNASRAILIIYATTGVLKFALYTLLSPAIEIEAYLGKFTPSPHLEQVSSVANIKDHPSSTAPPVAPTSSSAAKLGLHRHESVRTVMRLSGLFAVDAFAGGFVMQTFLVFWFRERWMIDSIWLGSMLMAANVLSGVSGIFAGKLVSRSGFLLSDFTKIQKPNQ
jgi:hypothetical protein